ncbi:YihY/virulence factor BrkB family protein [Paenibacillus aurantius]|uniref:YihY/virulence factor BrkB family protein n=1 Tax=Paenibacillus aurantius TaxID=2918900 RepID=A0AA96LC90_9BACL|nr:YihY/virulence factor BrkB family protein [Paenibacillus aurantius]WNQ10493.1 YihY/virulence factor BrkB family protein [Paenibacillus aurantius]
MKTTDKPATKRMSLQSFANNLYCRFQDDEVPAMGAQLTYYLILSFFPFLIFLIALVSFMPFLNSGEIIGSISRMLPQTSNETIRSVLDEIQQSKSSTLLSVGIITTIWSASKGIDGILKALNKAYDEEETRPFWKVKGASIMFTLLMAVVIVFTFGMLIFGKWIGEMIFKFLHVPAFFDIIWSIAKYVLPLGMMAAMFVLLYRFIPNRHLSFREVLPGALFTTVGWIVTSLLFSFYVNNFGNYTKTYGSIGGIIVLLTWLYISSIIIVLGGEVNATLAFDREGKTKDSCKRFSLPLLGKKKDKSNRAPEVVLPLYNGKEADKAR